MKKAYLLCIIALFCLMSGCNDETTNTDEISDLTLPDEIISGCSSVIDSDGTEVDVCIVPTDKQIMNRAIEEGLISQELAREIEQLEQKLNLNTKIPLCSNIGVQRGSGWDSDDDYYKDYEHPEGKEYGYWPDNRRFHSMLFIWAAGVWLRRRECLILIWRSLVI